MKGEKTTNKVEKEDQVTGLREINDTWQTREKLEELGC